MTLVLVLGGTGLHVHAHLRSRVDGRLHASTDICAPFNTCWLLPRALVVQEQLKLSGSVRLDAGYLMDAALQVADPVWIGACVLAVHAHPTSNGCNVCFGAKLQS